MLKLTITNIFMLLLTRVVGGTTSELELFLLGHPILTLYGQIAKRLTIIFH